VQVLELGRARWGCSKMGTVALDGTKIQPPMPAGTARLSYEHAGKIEAQLKSGSGRAVDAGRKPRTKADVPDGHVDS